VTSVKTINHPGRNRSLQYVDFDIAAVMDCKKSPLCTLVQTFVAFVFNCKILKHKGSQSRTQRNTKVKTVFRCLFQQPQTYLSFLFLLTSDFQLRTSDFGLPASDFRLRTSDFLLRSSVFGLPTFKQITSQ
jgi:hypothetical protein